MQSIPSHALSYDDAFCEIPAFGVCGKRNQNPRVSTHPANAFESPQANPDIPGFGSDLMWARIQIFLPDLRQSAEGNLFYFPAQIIPGALIQPASEAVLIVNPSEDNQRDYAKDQWGQHWFIFGGAMHSPQLRNDGTERRYEGQRDTSAFPEIAEVFLFAAAKTQ